MFGQPPSSAASAAPATVGHKRGAEERATEGQSESNGQQQSTTDKKQKEIIEAIAQLTLQLEGERRAKARDENYVFEMAKGSELAKVLAWAEQAYKQDGDKLRKEQGEDYKGHPNGKKPDALLASLLLRVSEEVEKAGRGQRRGVRPVEVGAPGGAGEGGGPQGTGGSLRRARRPLRQ